MISSIVRKGAATPEPSTASGTVVETPYAIDNDALRSAFEQGGLYPVSLTVGAPPQDVLSLHARWLGACRKTFRGQPHPWVPVGRVGPALILGHDQPGLVPPPLPRPCFQPVLLRRTDYERHLDQCMRLFENAAHDSQWLPPLAALPEPFILPTSDRGAWQFLREYFPHEKAVLPLLDSLMEKGWHEIPSLPPGYRGALHLLGRRSAVADPSMLQFWPEWQARVPEPWRDRVRVIASHARDLWIGATHWPQPELEDALLDELGEGWHIHAIWLDGPRTVVPGGKDTADNNHGSDEGGECNGRSRITLDPPKNSTVGQGGARSAIHPGEIRLSVREIAALAAYDPRRPDRDPVKVFLRELSAAIQSGASDLHVEPGIERARVRARIDGRLEEWLEMGADFGQTLVGAAKEMLGLPAEKYLPQDGSCTVFHGAETVNVRVSSFPLRRRCQKLVLRFLPRRGRVPPLESLLPAREARILQRAAASPYGLILLCGPTGSGKTTTVFSTLASLNTPERNITTMEDPVEYELEGVNQAELDIPRGANWDTLLRGFLRQDPDAGLIGEIRDRATAETAIRQALTGHVVFATLHTLSCAQTVERLIDMSVNPDLLASALTLVVSQRLVRRVCTRCRKARSTTRVESRLFERHGLAAPPELFDPEEGGCPACRQGYKGRAAAVEVLPITEEVAAMIEEKQRARAYRTWAGKQSLTSVYGAALRLAGEGVTTVAEANEWQAVWEDFDFT